MTVPAGWYADPTDGGRWRWFDGQAWTEHVSAPPAAPAPAAAAAAAPAYAYAGSTVAPPVQWWRRTSRTRVLVIAGATLAGLVAVGAAGSAGAWTGRTQAAGTGAGFAEDRSFQLGKKPPAKVSGLSRSRSAGLIAVGEKLRSQADQSLRGSDAALVQTYGSMSGRRAVLVWVTVHIPIAQKAEGAAVETAFSLDGGTAITRADLDDGATQVCATVPESKRHPRRRRVPVDALGHRDGAPDRGGTGPEGGGRRSRAGAGPAQDEGRLRPAGGRRVTVREIRDRRARRGRGRCGA